MTDYSKGRVKMRSFYTALIISTLGLAAAACGDKKPDPNAANQDFLTSQSSTGAVVSPQELGLRDSLKPAPVAVTPVAAKAPARTTTHRSSTTRRRSTSSSGTVATTPQAPATVTVKHTKRDAAIGAAAGAVIGGVAGHGIKGAVIGGVVGGVLGGVIGNNVDKQKKPQ
jgi:hypothetical protein